MSGEPSTVEAIVDLIRRPGAGLGLAVSREAAIALVEQYAAVVASEAAIAKAQVRDFCAESGCSGYEEVFEAARDRALPRTPVTAASPSSAEGGE